MYTFRHMLNMKMSITYEMRKTSFLLNKHKFFKVKISVNRLTYFDPLTRNIYVEPVIKT